jgi:HTH-type transcriptional regulator, sugar sensing transcriptional regulator
MDEQLISQVEDLGLSNKEARVYVASLMLGPSPVQKIADFAAVKRVTAYVILESLVNLGLVSQTTKGKKTLFTAEEPVTLKRLLTKKEQALAEQKSNLESLLPELLKLKSLPNESPEVKFYDSAEGIRSIMASFLSQSKTEGLEMIYGITNVDQLFEFFPDISQSHSNPDRLAAGLPSKVVYTSTQGPVYAATDKEKNRQSRFVPYEKFPINGDITIVGDRIVMLSLTGTRPIGITIKSRELAQSMMGLFNLAWETAEPHSSRKRAAN